MATGMGMSGFHRRRRSSASYWRSASEWRVLGAMNSSHLCHGICYDSERKMVAVLGGTRIHQSHQVEFFNFDRNRWFNLPPTVYPHKWFPALKMADPWTMVCLGNDYNFTDDMGVSGWGHSE